MRLPLARGLRPDTPTLALPKVTPRPAPTLADAPPAVFSGEPASAAAAVFSAEPVIAAAVVAADTVTADDVFSGEPVQADGAFYGAPGASDAVAFFSTTISEPALLPPNPPVIGSGPSGSSGPLGPPGQQGLGVGAALGLAGLDCGRASPLSPALLDYREIFFDVAAGSKKFTAAREQVL